MALTAKQRAFVTAYLSNGFNGTQAVISAGYSERGAAVTAHDLLRNTNIKAEIERYFDEFSMTAGEVLARLTAIGRGDLGDVWDESTGQIDWKRARALGKTGLLKRVRHKTTRIESKDGDTEVFEDEVELLDTLKALQLIGKERGMFIDRTEHTGKDGGAIEITYKYPDDANSD